jgi:hypothetical protein
VYRIKKLKKVTKAQQWAIEPLIIIIIIIIIIITVGITEERDL